MMEFVIDEKTAGKSVKDFLFHELRYSNGMVKKLKFRENGITVNGNHVTVRFILSEGDIVRLRTEDTEAETCPYMIPVDLPIKIAYEDENLTVVDKPPMMPAHPSFNHRLDTVANALAHRYSDSPFVFRPVNRLDRDTSGLMLTTRNRLAASRLYESMISGEISKIYIALLSRKPESDSGYIRTYMKRKDDSIIERCVCTQDAPGALLAVSAYKVIYSCDDFCAVMASPITGRTHQLRVHFSHIGCPLLGDTMYGGPVERIGRQALHSAYLSFPNPDGGRIEVYSPLPDDMRSVLGDMAEKADTILKNEVHGEMEAVCRFCRDMIKQ